nr:expansin/Lol pI [Tanacetum cinerariifolium]
KVVDILCNLELIYPPAFFDIISHLVIYLPLEALEGAYSPPGYVAEEALTFSSYYFWDVTTKFNHPDRNVDPPPLTCQFQVFGSLCKSIGLRSIIRFDAQELKKVIWYLLHSSPEIDTYRSRFKSKFPNKDMKQEFPDWFGSQIRQRHVDNDPGVSTTSKLFALACGPTPTPISVNSCVVNSTRFVMHNRDERRTTQNNGICSPGGKNGEMYYGQLQEILEFSYLSFKVVLFRVKWFDTSNEERKVKHLVLRNNMTQILKEVRRLKMINTFSQDKGVIVVEEDPDVIHFDNSSDLPLSTSLNDLDNATLHIDGQSTEVDAPPAIIDLDEDDDIFDDKDALPRDLANSDDEDLVNVDDDDCVDVVYSNICGTGHDGGGDDRPLHTIYPLVAGVASLTERKAVILIKIGTQFDLTPHMQSQRWTYINAGIQQHLQKLYNTNKAFLKAAHWVINPETGTYDVESIRQRRGDVEAAGSRLQHPVGCGDDEMANDEDDDEDKEDEEDDDS